MLSRRTCKPPELIYAGSNSSRSASPTDKQQDRGNAVSTSATRLDRFNRCFNHLFRA